MKKLLYILTVFAILFATLGTSAFDSPIPAAGPARPTLSSPGNGSSWPQPTVIELKWNSVAGATQYKVELWGGPYSTMVPCNWVSGTSCWIGTMWPGTMYWHVKARNGTGEGDWSDTWSFVIQNGGGPTPVGTPPPIGGTPTPPPYVPQQNTKQAPCKTKPDQVFIGSVTDYVKTHYYIGYVIPDSTGSDGKPNGLVVQKDGMAQPFSNNGWISDIISGKSTKTITIGPIFGKGPFTKTIDLSGGPILVNGPGDHEGHRFKGDPNPPITLPKDTWHIFIPNRLLLGIGIELWPGMVWTISPVGNEYYGNNPGSVAYLQCNYPEVTTPNKSYYILRESIGIAGSEVGNQYRYAFDFPSWMTSASVILRTGSDAKISLRGPDGTIYNASHPQVEYTHMPQYSVLKLNQSGGGQWEALIDVTAAQPDSVFFLSIGGTYGDSANADILAPFTNITIDATHGNNPWLVSNARITLSADDAGGSGVAKIEWSVDEGASWNQYSGPVTISQEGLTVFTARATDNVGNVEILPPTKYLRIDKTQPVVSVSTDQSQYTRVQLFTPHFSGYDPTPGSGLASLTATFNGQSVSDGQSIDMFWWNLGQYTLTATGVDNAGWVTTNSKTIKLIATIQSLQKTVSRLCTEKYITKQGICNSFLQKLNAALAAQQRGQKNTAINVLSALQNELQAQNGKAVSIKAYNLLMMDSTYVIQSLR